MLLSNIDLLATAPGGVARFRKLILTLAVQGKLLPQDPADEPASGLMKKIRAEKDRLIAEGKIKRDKPLAGISEAEQPFELPKGWEWVSLGDIGLVGSSSRVHQSDWKSSGVPFYRAREIVKLSRAGFVANELFISEELFSALAQGGWVPEENDIMITGVGTIGVPYIVKASDRFYFKDASVLIFKNYGRLNAEFLSLFMTSPLWIDRIHADSMGTTVDTLTIARANNALVPLPPLAEQSRIVTRVEELLSLCDALEAKGLLEAKQHDRLLSTLLGTLTASTDAGRLAESWQRVATHFDLLLDRPEAVDAVEQTLLQLAVRGQLVPQDPADEPASELLKKIRAEKDRLIQAGHIKRDKPLEPITDEERPFELPVGWEWVRIDEVAEVQGGIQKTQLRKPVKEHYPYLRVANVQRDALRLDEIERFELTKDELAKWRLVAGDLLIVEGNGSADEIGRCAVWDGSIDPCVCQNHLIRVRCLQPESMAFIKLFLNAPSGTDEMKRLAITTSGLYNLSVGKIRNFVVPMPGLAEQSRIVARVESLRRLCTDLRQHLSASQTTQAKLAEALVESQMA